MRISLILILMVWFAAGSARAEPIALAIMADGFTYYNRPGATLAQHNDELAACVNDNQGPVAKGYRGPGLVFQAIWGGTVAAHLISKAENCMLVRGWRVVRFDDEEGKRLRDLLPGLLSDRLGTEVGAAEPRGRVVRTWGNEIAYPPRYRVDMFKMPPFNKKQLSFKLLAEGKDRAVPPPVWEGFPPIDKPWSKRPVKPERLASRPAGSSVIVVRVKSGGTARGNSFSLRRVGLNPLDQPGRRDRAPDNLLVAGGGGGPDSLGDWFAFIVPPGTWRIGQVGFFDLCLGSPGFEVGPNEIVYAGAFDIGGERLGPNLDLEPARSWLGLDASANLRVAEYENGYVGDCHTFLSVYALELPGVPFRPGYAWGSATGR